MDKPVLFSAPMVRALLEGRKTQTRRIVRSVPDRPAMDNIAWPNRKLHPEPYLDAYCGGKRTPENPRGMTADWAYWTRDDRPGPLFNVRHVPGDRLWVREAWKTDRAYDDLAPSEMGGEEPLIFDADKTVERWGWKPDPLSRWGRFRQGMHMPRWASRLTLTVTDVRVQRVQEISDEDAVAEGCAGFVSRNGEDGESPREEFRTLWDSLNASRGFGWDANPWVAAYTFTVEKRNIDA